MQHSENISTAVREFILSEFLPGEDPNELTDTTPLMTGAVLDSIATLKLAAFLEERFGIALEAHDLTVANLNAIRDIVRLVESKVVGP